MHKIYVCTYKHIKICESQSSNLVSIVVIQVANQPILTYVIYAIMTRVELIQSISVISILEERTSSQRYPWGCHLVKDLKC